MNDYLGKFSEQEAHAAAQSLAATPDTIALLDRLTACITHGVSLLTNMANDRSLNFLVGLILSRAFASLRSGRQIAIAGYPAQAMILARAVLEEWGTICWVEAHPDTVDRWLWAVFPEKYSPPDGRTPSFNEMLAGLEDSDAYRSVYDVLSKFGYPRSEGFVFQSRIDGAFHEIHFAPTFNADGLDLALRALIPAAFLLMGPIQRWQERVLGAADPEWVAGAEQFEGEIVALLKGKSDQ